MLIFSFLTVGLALAVQFTPVSKSEEEKVQEEFIAPDEEVENSSLELELNEAELRKIVAEEPNDDPLNAFFDPFENYRLSTYAYWHPITIPEHHENPLIPVGFIPPNAPPKSLPSDFFVLDDEARRIVLSEHAAAFCPYLRRWRERHPLKPYPIANDFVHKHPPIRFVPGKGYEIDTFLARINILSHRIEEGILHAEELAIEKEIEEYNLKVAKKKKNKKKKKKEEKRAKKSIWDHENLIGMIERIQKIRPDCKKYSDFLKPPAGAGVSFSSPLSCLQEAIFLLDELEDLKAPIDRDDEIAEIPDKVEHYRQVLLKIEDEKKEIKGKKGKCPFGFKSGEKPVELPKMINYKGNIPEWAELKPGEELLPSDVDSDLEKMEKYRFPYKQVPFPSIQDTLKRYVSL